MIAKQKGVITIYLLFMALLFSMLAAGISEKVQVELKTRQMAEENQTAQYAAEAGVQEAFAEITEHPADFRTSWTESLPGTESTFSVTVKQNGRDYFVESTSQFSGIHKRLTATVTYRPGVDPPFLFRVD